MEFNLLCDILYPFLHNACKTKDALFNFLVLNVISADEDDLRDEIDRLTKEQKANIVRGTNSFGHVARKIYGKYDDSDLQERLEEEIMDRPAQDLAKKLKPYCPSINKNNFGEKICNLMHKIVSEASSSYRQRKNDDELGKKELRYQEVGGCCPICHCHLTFAFRKAETICIVRVDENEGDGDGNLLAVCSNCYEALAKGKTKLDLRRIKKSLALSSNDGLLFDEELFRAVERLVKSSDQNLCELSYEALPIAKKISSSDDASLFYKVRFNVAQYFPRLRELFKGLVGESHSYDKLASSIRTAFLRIDEGKDKENTFNALTNLIVFKTDCSLSVAEAIVSYFIQDCEVFYEIAK